MAKKSKPTKRPVPGSSEEVVYIAKRTRRGYRLHPVPVPAVPGPSTGRRSPSRPQTSHSSRTREPLQATDSGEEVHIQVKSKAHKSGRSQNDYLREWLPYRDTYLNEMLKLESSPTHPSCAKCGILPGRLRCKDCFGGLFVCQSCCISGHTNLPFHRVESWVNGHFQDSSLHQEGFIMHLGHGGQPCPAFTSEETDTDDGLEVEEEDIVEDVDNLLGQWEMLDEHVIIVVDCSGIHQRRLRWCQCKDAPEKHIQLLRDHLFPASLIRPSTVFTFQVLDYFHVDAVECKTSAMNFFSKLRRVTNYTVPGSVPDRYRELMRVSRMWRNLVTRKRAGLGHMVNRVVGSGDLALFCPACPQPGINLPQNWEEDPEQWIYRRTIVVDGNFSAEHMKMRNPEDDVALTNGDGYMVGTARYEAHLKSSEEQKVKSKCHNHKAVNRSNMSSDNLEATGIGAVACARHGCFYPHSVVDFQKGERQINIDYAVCEALKQMTGIREVILCYDVACQWILHFHDRINGSRYLDPPQNLKIIPAVGKFHLGAHIDECFPKFSLNFILGAGQLDGEIIETLWWPIDKIAPLIRAMMKSHRREVLDDNMYDSNWKKWVGIVASLIKKRRNAAKGDADMRQAYKQLTASLDPKWIAAWTEEEESALQNRGDELKIYTINKKAALSQAEKRFQLLETESTSSNKGSVAWLVTGLSIEQAQSKLQMHVRSLGSRPTLSAKTDLAERRQRLDIRIDRLNKQASAFIQAGEEDEIQPISWINIADDHLNLSDNEEEASEIDEAEDVLTENIPLLLPSSLTTEQRYRWKVDEMEEQERELRIGQANDALELLRDALAQKSLVFRTQVRNARSQKTMTRSWGEVHKLNIQVRTYARTYNRARAALSRLNSGSEILEKYKKIQAEDLKMPGDIIEENRIGQRNDTMAWFWRLDESISRNPQDWMKEFYKVNWLRAKARYNRWSEELTLVEREMEWTVIAFQYHGKLWHERAGSCVGRVEKRGHYAYALQQKDMWNDWAKKALRIFTEL